MEIAEKHEIDLTQLFRETTAAAPSDTFKQNDHEQAQNEYFHDYVDIALQTEGILKQLTENFEMLIAVADQQPEESLAQDWKEALRSVAELMLKQPNPMLRTQPPERLLPFYALYHRRSSFIVQRAEFLLDAVQQLDADDFDAYRAAISGATRLSEIIHQLSLELATIL